MSITVDDVVILGWNDVPAGSRPQKIAEFLGIQAKHVLVGVDGLTAPNADPRAVSKCTCLVTDAETLARAAETMEAADLLRLTIDRAEYMFVYGFQPTARHGVILQMLSSGDIRSVAPLSEQYQFQVTDGFRSCCGQFSGLSFGATDQAIDRHFVNRAKESQHDALIRVGGKPFFVRSTVGRCQVFLSACAELADLDEPVGRRAQVLSWFSRLLPLMMCLREALGNRVWCNDRIDRLLNGRRDSST